MSDDSHAVAVQRFIRQEYESLTDLNKEKLSNSLLKDFYLTLGSRKVLVGPNFFSHSYPEKRIDEDGQEYEIQKHYITWVARTTNYDQC